MYSATGTLLAYPSHPSKEPLACPARLDHLHSGPAKCLLPVNVCCIVLVCCLPYPDAGTCTILPMDFARLLGWPIWMFISRVSCMWKQHLDREWPQERRNGLVCSTQSFENVFTHLLARWKEQISVSDRTVRGCHSLSVHFTYDL